VFGTVCSLQRIHVRVFCLERERGPQAQPRGDVGHFEFVRCYPRLKLLIGESHGYVGDFQYQEFKIIE